MPFGPVDPGLDLPALEERVLARWREHEVVEEVARLRKGAEPWIFYEGPPTANGQPGLHHVWARAFKDLFPRFQTMRGRDVPRKGGWDCHGLPVELEVEKELGLATKADIEAYGIEAFNQRCRESVQRYVEDWSALTERSAVWIDTADAYWTLDNDYIESVWWIIRQLWDKGLLYEGHRVTPYCGRCGTALSSHEVAQGYEDVVDPSIYVRFPLTAEANGGAAPDADLLVWTTTPWTLISNVAAAVGPAFTYVRIAAPDGGRDLVLGERAAARLFPEAEVRERWRGTDLAGWRYRRPFDFIDPPPRGREGWRVVVADYVSDDDGSGVVHLAPAFGEDDAQVGRAEGLPVLNPVDADATFDHTVPPWQGRFVKDADPEIIADLRRRGLLVAEQPYEHSYPHCWRCGTPLIYWAKTSWFVRTEERRADLLAQNETIGWYPEHIKHGRFGRWLETNVDWALSRDRYWGTPLPIWRCRGCGSDTCIGSVAELSELAGRDLSDLDLHRPYVDDITWTCTEPGVPRHGPPPPAGARRLVRLGIDAVGPVPPPVRRRRAVRGQLPRRLHLRGHRPDAGLVLLAAGGQHAGVRLDALPQRRVPRAPRRRAGPEDVEVEGQRHRPLADLHRLRRRRPALVLLLGRPAVDDQAAWSRRASASPPARPC